MYPHDNLNSPQLDAIDRLDAPWFAFKRGWREVLLTDTDRKGMTFYPRERRTWTVYIKGYLAVQVQGRVQDRHGRTSGPK